MALLLQVTRDSRPFIEEFARQMPELEVRAWPELGNPDDIEFAAVSRIPAGQLSRLRNLRLVISMLAGVEHLVDNPEISPDIPIVRSGAPDGDRMITEYVLLHVLRHHRQMPAYAVQQSQSLWRNLPQPPAEARSIGFLGLGLLGLAAAKAVRDHGFRVLAWTRSQREVEGIECHHGAGALSAFLGKVEILVNLLPATPETEGIVDAGFLAQLPTGAQFINIARGQHVVDADLLAALDAGQLAGATLDVFHEEPLPASSPLWRHPLVTVMPHAARKLFPGDSVPSIIENIRRFRSGQPLLMPVDRQRGY